MSEKFHAGILWYFHFRNIDHDGPIIKKVGSGTDHVVGDLPAGVRAEVELELDRLVLLVRGFGPPGLALVGDSQPEVDDGVGRVDQVVPVDQLQLEAGVLGEELVLEKLSHRRSEMLVVDVINMLRT